MTDRIIAIIALLVFAASLLTIVVFVPSPDLVIVMLLAIGFACADFFKPIFGRSRKNKTR